MKKPFILSLTVLSIGIIAGISYYFYTKEKSPKTIINEVPLIQAPIPELVPEFKEKQFDAQAGITWNFGNGTSIKIPANSLIYKDSNLVQGAVTLQFRDYHDATDIFLSGIPMKFRFPDKTEGNMQSAGMFELRVFSEENEVLLKEKSKAQIKLATAVPDKGYNSFFLDEEKRTWIDLGENKAQKNTIKINSRKKVRSLKPDIIFPLTGKYFALDYYTLLDVYFNDNRKKFDHTLLKSQLKKYGLDWLNNESKDGVIYNGKKKPAALMVWKNISGKKISQWAENGSSEFFFKKNNMYEMKIKSKGNTDSTFIKVELVMPINYLFKLPPEEWNNDYQLAFSKFKKEEKRMKLMADFTRDISINNFGIYNYDRIMEEEDKALILAEFNFKEKFDENVSQPDVYYIPGEGRAVIRYPHAQWKEFPLMPDKNGKIISVLPGNKLSVFSQKKYASIDFGKLKKEENPQYLFEMETQINEITSVEDIRKIFLN